jgi:hypothetical protein
MQRDRDVAPGGKKTVGVNEIDVVQFENEL